MAGELTPRWQAFADWAAQAGPAAQANYQEALKRAGGTAYVLAPVPPAPPLDLPPASPSTKPPTEQQLSQKYGTTVVLSPSNTMIFPDIGDTGVRPDGSVISPTVAALKLSRIQKLGILSSSGQQQIIDYLKTKEQVREGTVHVGGSMAFVEPTTGTQEVHRQRALEIWQQKKTDANKVYSDAEAKLGRLSVTRDEFLAQVKSDFTSQGDVLVYKPNFAQLLAANTLQTGGYLDAEGAITSLSLEQAVTNLGADVAITTLKNAGFENPSRMVTEARQRIKIRSNYSEFIDKDGNLQVVKLVSSYGDKPIPADKVVSDLQLLGYAGLTEEELLKEQKKQVWWATATPEQRFHAYVEQGDIPAGSLYAGQNPDDKTQPMYYEATPKQLQSIEQQFLKDSDGAPVYIHDLMVRSGITPVVVKPKWNVDVEKNYVALKEQWDSLPAKEKQKVLAVYYHQMTEEEGRATSISLPQVGMMYIGATSEAIRRRTIETAQKYLQPDLQMPAIVGVAVATTIGEMAIMLPTAIAEIALNPSFIKDVAIGMKDFTVDAAKGVGRADPWAIGQMAVIVGALYLGGKPLVRAVAIRTPAMAAKAKIALGNLDTAIRNRSLAAIQKAAADLKAIGKKIHGTEGDALIRLGEGAKTQARNLSTMSTETIEGIKISLENAGTKSASVTSRMEALRVQGEAFELRLRIAELLNKAERVGGKEAARLRTEATRLTKEVTRLEKEAVRLQERAVAEEAGAYGETLEQRFQKAMEQQRTEKTTTLKPEEADMSIAEFSRFLEWRLNNPKGTAAQFRKVEGQKFDSLLQEIRKSGQELKKKAVEEEGVSPAIKEKASQIVPLEQWAEIMREAVKQGKGIKVAQELRIKKAVKESKALRRKAEEAEIASRAKEIAKRLAEREAMVRAIARRSLKKLLKMRDKAAIARLLRSLDETQLMALLAINTKAMLAALAKLEPKQREKLVALLGIKLAPKVKEAIATQTKIEAKTATLTELRTQTKIETKLKRAVAVDLHLRLQEELLEKFEVPVLVSVDTIKPISPKPIGPKKDKPKRFIPPILPSLTTSAGKKALILKGAAGWKQGFIYKYVIPVRGKKAVRILHTRKPIKGIPLVKGPKSAFKSITQLGLYFPKEVLIDMGIMDVQILKGGKKLRFIRDPKQKTKTNRIVVGEPVLTVSR